MPGGKAASRSGGHSLPPQAPWGCGATTPLWPGAKRSSGSRAARGRSAWPLPRRCASLRPRTRSSWWREAGRHRHRPVDALAALLEGLGHGRPAGGVDRFRGERQDLGDAAAGGVEHAAKGSHRPRRLGGGGEEGNALVGGRIAPSRQANLWIGGGFARRSARQALGSQRDGWAPFRCWPTTRPRSQRAGLTGASVNNPG